MKSFSLIVFLALCITCQEEPATALTCRETETADSVISRRQWILECVKTQTSSPQTSADQLEQKEDIIDECADHSWKLRVTTCEPQLEVYDGTGYRDCAGFSEKSVQGQACGRARLYYESTGKLPRGKESVRR